MSHDEWIFTCESSVNNNKVIFAINSEDVNGNVNKYTTGFLTHELKYDQDGRKTEIKDSNSDKVFNWSCYTYDNATGNLLGRQDLGHSYTENFKYDALNRLIEFGNNKIEYNELGNITYSSYVGNYYYNSDKPYSVTSVDNTNGSLTTNAMIISYNSQLRANSIEQNNKKILFDYDIDGNRICSSLTSPISNESCKKYYLGGNYEITTRGSDVREIFYLGGDAYSANNVLVRNNSGSWTLYDLCKDNLSSIVTIVSEAGNVVQDVSYDAWGNMRNPATGELKDYELFLDRGYTGHEYLAVFGLINMNARLYSPKTCRFLSPDPLLQLGNNDQNLNRYTYCLNNPFRYTDPSGKFVITATVFIAMGVAAVIGGAANLIYQACSGNIHSFWDGLSAFGIGAVAGAGGALAGLAACAAVGITAVGLAGGALAGAVGAGVSSTLSGFGNYLGFNQPMSWSSVGWSVAGGAVVGGLVGGVTALCKGQNVFVNKVPKGVPTPQVSNPSSEDASQTQGANSVGSGEAQSAAKSSTQSATGIPRDHSLSIIERQSPMPYPLEDGYEGGKPLTTTEHVSGEVFDRVVRYDGNEGEALERMYNGRYLTDVGTPFEMRALPYSPDRTMHMQIEVLKTIQTYDGKAAPWALFNSPGGASQYMTKMPIGNLISSGQIKVVGLQIHFDGTVTFW